MKIPRLFLLLMKTDTTIGNDCVSARQVKSSAPLPFPACFITRRISFPAWLLGLGRSAGAMTLALVSASPDQQHCLENLRLKNQKISREVCDTMDNKAVDLNYDKVITFSKIYKNKLKWILIQPLS